MERNTETLMAIRAVTKAYSQIIKQLGDQYGLTQIETNIISFLKNNHDLDTASDIIELRGFSKAIVSQGVDGLVKKGMLAREEDSTDKRIVHLRLTPLSAPVAEALNQARQKFNARCFAGFTDRQRQQYLELTDRILANLLTK